MAAGVSKVEIAPLRMEYTGLRRPMSKKWAKTIGLWGGQKTAKEIAELTQETEPKVRSYAQYRGLTLRRKSDRPMLQVSIAEQAFRMSTHYADRTPQWIAQNACGILPPEYLYYIQRMEIFEDMIRESEGLGLQELFEEYELEHVQEFWVASKSELKAPDEKELASIRTRLRG